MKICRAINFRGTATALAAAMLVWLPSVGQAAPPGAPGDPVWVLADQPLYLGTAVPPNIIFVIDDSGTMDYEVMTLDSQRANTFYSNQPDGTNDPLSGDITHQTADLGVDSTTGLQLYCDPVSLGYYGYVYGVDFTDNAEDAGRPCHTASDFSWRFRSSSFNPMYFNPYKDYLPWAGTDESGNLFTDANLISAKSKPWNTNAGQYYTIDLSKQSGWRSSTGVKRDVLTGGWRFYTWQDTVNPGKFDNTDTITEYAIGSLTDVEAKTFGGRTAAQVQQNFANWFQYYRSRDLLAKAAFGRVIDSLYNVRMGLISIHNNNIVNTPVALVNSTPEGLAAKKTLMDNIYRITPGSHTPLRDTYKQVGKYLSGGVNSAISAAEKAPLPAGLGGECQQNFALILTDGGYDGTYNDATTPIVGNADGNGSSTWDQGAYADTYDKTLADIAMYFYENDIVPETANAVPTTPPLDYNNAQHVVTYAISFGATGTLADMPADATAPFAWPNPIDETDPNYKAYRVDDLRHAAYNGRGEFLAASNPDQLVAAIKHMIDSIQARTSASAALSFNTTTVRTDTLIYQARYNSGDWTGDLNLVPFKDLGQTIIEVRNAGYLLTSRLDPGHIKPVDRHIITEDGGKGIVAKAYEFRWPNMTAAQQTTLSNVNVLQWVRGEQRCEQVNGVSLDADAVNGCPLAATDADLPFRERSRVLGDIVNSASIFVGPPNKNYPFPGYDVFTTTYAARKGVVYVSSNDGMLHGFNSDMNPDGTFTAETGREVLAFLPNRNMAKIRQQADPAYGHKYAFDGSASAGDAYFQDLRNGKTAWYTVVVAGQRTGGQAVQALNVTTPYISKPTELYMWEFSDADDADMGFAFSKPAIVRLNTADNDGSGDYGVLIANGINSTFDDTATGGKVGSGENALFVVDIADAKVIKALKTKGYATDPTWGKSNGLTGMTPVDIDLDYDVDLVYATDISGYLWRFDLRDPSPLNWFISFGGTPIFKTESPEVTPQPITSSPAVALHPTGTGFMIFFGTGKYFEDIDNNVVGADTQSFYAIWDKWVTDPEPTGFTTLTRANLLQQQILEETFGGLARVTTDYTLDWSTTTLMGWYMDLVNLATGNNQGERVVTDPVYRNGRILFSTMIPGGKVCEFGGSGWLMNLGAFDGARSSLPVFDTNNDGLFTTADLLADSTGNMVAVSGAKSTHGIPSAPALITSASGTYDNLLINFSDGSMGGTGTFTTDVAAPVDSTTVQFDETLQVPPSNELQGANEAGIVNIMAPTGRLLWKRER